MTRTAKLYRKLLDGRPLTFAELESLVLRFGFKLDRVVGSHHIYRRDDIPERINLQPKGKEAKPYQRRQFLDMIVTYGLTLDEKE